MNEPNAGWNGRTRVSRDQIFRRERGQGNSKFPVQLSTRQERLATTKKAVDDAYFAEHVIMANKNNTLQSGKSRFSQRNKGNQSKPRQEIMLSLQLFVLTIVPPDHDWVGCFEGTVGVNAFRFFFQETFYYGLLEQSIIICIIIEHRVPSLVTRHIPHAGRI